MRVEITEIGKNDMFYANNMAGSQGTFAVDDMWDDGFFGGEFYPDDGTTKFYFHKIKTKPIFDDQG